MASSHHMPRGPGSVDVLAVLTAFEEINECRIVVEIVAESTTKLAVMHVIARALEKTPQFAVPQQLASQKLIVGFHSQTSLDNLILQVLYKLDAQLDAEKSARGNKKA